MITLVRGRYVQRTSSVVGAWNVARRNPKTPAVREGVERTGHEVGRSVSSLRDATSRETWGEYHAACLAHPLGLVSRLVRCPHQLLGSLLGSYGDADAR